jgi:hypothetical protein
MRLLVNGVIEPLLVIKFAVVGLAVVFQQIPCAVIGAPPVAVTSPPEVAVDDVIEDTAVVVTVGVTAGVVKLSSVP